jgi:outer membrane protein assembly factor BamB
MDWPGWRGPLGDGISPFTGINKNWTATPPALLWKVALTDGGYAGPSEADGVVFIIDHVADQDVVRALNLTDGSEVWRFAYADTAQADNGFARATPLVAGGKVYTQSRLGKLNCLDEKTGALVWSRDIKAEFSGKQPQWAYSASPLLDEKQLVVVPGGATSIVALNPDTGATLWQGGADDQAGYTQPVVATILGVKQYVCFTGTMLQGVAADTGKLLWSYPWKTSYNVNSATPLVSANQIFITSGYGHGCAMLEITAAGPQLKWENKEILGKFNAPISYQGYIFGGGDGFFACLNPATGAPLWKRGGVEQVSVVGLDGVLLILNGGSGVMTMMTASAEQEILGEFTPLGGQSWTPPIIAQGKLIVRNKTALACYDLK